jgi:hypothetical protein
LNGGELHEYPDISFLTKNFNHDPKAETMDAASHPSFQQANQRSKQFHHDVALGG